MSTHPGPSPRSIDVSDIVSRVLETYQKTAGVLIVGALIVFLPVALLTALLGDGAASIIAALVSLVASVWYSGMVVKTVQDVQDGRVDSSLGELFGSVTPVLGQLLLLGIVAGIAIGFGLVLLIVPGLILLTIWSVAAPVAVVEKPGVFAALGRSRALVAGNAWRVFAVIVVIFVILFVVSIVVASIGAVADSFVLSVVVDLVINVLLAPIYALAAAVLYFALREAHDDGASPGGPPVSTDAFGRQGGPSAPEVPGSAWQAPPAGGAGAP